MADSAILPYNLESFPKSMKETLEEFDSTSTNVTSLLTKGDVTLKYVKDAVKEFEANTKLYMENLKEIKKNHDPMKLRIANDQMMQLERVFNMPKGLPGF